MADNVTIPASGNGTATPVVATDDVDGVHYQKVKLDVGGDGASVPVDGELPIGGDVAHDAVDSGNPVKTGGVANESQPSAVANGDRVDAWFQRDGAQSVTIIGGNASGNQLEVDASGRLHTELQSVTTTVPVNVTSVLSPLSTAGNGTAATAHRVTIASDSTGVVGLAAGTNNIGDVDVLSIAAGDNNIGNVDIVTMPNVTLNEPVSVDDNGGSLTVDAAGDVAHDAVDAGNPVKIGGVASSTVPANVTTGDRVNAWFQQNGAQVVFDLGPYGEAGSDGVGNDPLIAAASVDGSGGPLKVAGSVFNGTTWDRQRGDTLGIHVSRQATAATATLTNVSDTATSTTLLALNANRKGATIHNDSTAILYVKFGTTASATSYTVKMAADAHYEVPFGYTGRIDGIWASDASGAARITELT